MNSSEANRIAQHLNLSRQDQDLLSTRPVDFFSIHASNLPPQLSILFKSQTNPFNRSRIQTIKKRRINYANQTRPIQLTIDEARKRLPFLYSETLDLKDEDPSNASLGNHSIGRNSDREAMDKRLDHILDVVEEELVKERFRNQKEKHLESLPEIEEQDHGDQVRNEEGKEMTSEEKEDLEYENMLEFERKVMQLYLEGDPSLPTDFYDEIDFDDRWDTNDESRAGWSREDEDHYFDQEEES